MKALLVGLAIVVTCLTQSCKSPTNTSVDWFVILNAPASLSEGYLYFDSNTQTSEFTKYQTKSDALDQPLSTTLSQINTDPSLSYIAWNDENPNGTTTSVKAHSKTVLIYNNATLNGIVLVHSIPKYPNFTSNKVDPTIADGQRIYGQHILCFRATPEIMKELIDLSSVIRRNVYASNANIPAEKKSDNLFQYSYFTVANFNFRVIYKNGYINGSIFEDGLTQLLNSDLLAESWGRPIQEPWCGSAAIPHSTGNSELIEHLPDFSWKRTQDHSKWAIPVGDEVNYSCLGDMNRMVSQWKRGGGFYCVESPKLKAAFLKLIAEEETCS